MSQAGMDATEARYSLYRIMQTDASFTEKAEQALELGEEYLGVANGHVTRVDPENDYWKAIASSDTEDGQFPPGLLLDYGTTYCRRTVESEGSVALHEATAQGWGDDPAYETHGLECYHGTPLTVEDDLYGTVCFVREEARETPFAEDETMFAELIGRMLEHELEQRRTREKIERLDQFASIVSHDLRNPLNVAKLGVEAAFEARESEHLTEASMALERMDGLIDDVLAVARQGRDLQNVENVHLSALAERGWRTVATGGATLDIGTDCQFSGDPERLRQFFENLFRNAIEHGGEDVTVTVGTLPDRDGLYVADDGPGIPAEDRECVFDSGFSTDADGSGLGLAIVESIADAHEWTLTVTESADGGARFEAEDVVVALTE